MKTRVILIVSIALLAVALACLYGGRSVMKGGRLHRWLVLHSIRHSGTYKGEKVFTFESESVFITTTNKIYQIGADGTIRQLGGDSPYLYYLGEGPTKAILVYPAEAQHVPSPYVPYRAAD